MNDLDNSKDIYYNDDAVVIEDDTDLEDTINLSETFKGNDNNG